jgi:SAM-dependent methyltransferase
LDDCGTRSAASASTAAHAANLACYGGDGADAVARYTADPYHAVRREIAIELLVRGLERTDGHGALLDLGCGPASMLEMLPDDGRLHVNADISHEALLHTKGTRVRLDATAPLPFGSRTVAGVVMGELIEHLFAPGVLLREIHRVLRPGGALVVTTPNLATLSDRLGFLFGRSPRQVDAEHPYLRLHIRPFTKRSLKRILASADFDVAEVRSNYVGFRTRSGRWWQSRRLAKLLPTLGGALVVLAFRRS